LVRIGLISKTRVVGRFLFAFRLLRNTILDYFCKVCAGGVARCGSGARYIVNPYPEQEVVLPIWHGANGAYAYKYPLSEGNAFGDSAIAPEMVVLE
jgi:hypothetical protein